ncbi:sulfite exporter TauE/SafE family protein [Methylicorpusculum sp.]|uniref:sulfite exporter TauE/SafE family protein n=1 Tax=Methylicorpusculum sp. TaxID=2713644 RepID=UPI00271D2B0E|nr:sulfite exporter TauE/SafE family protein [Methylicorpusculum sp.]MDO8845647.1 sulfite exporter TauE/SafE family protein [Methylicorpusculum sp.]
MTDLHRNGKSFIAGSAVGTLGGLIGLGGAEFRLPVLVGVFRLNTLEAIILNKAMSLIVVTSGLLFRSSTISFDSLFGHSDIVLNLLAGSLIGAWLGAGHAARILPERLNLIVFVLLSGLGLLMLIESWLDVNNASAPFFQHDAVRLLVGLGSGFAIGIVAAMIGVAGGELLIPTIMLLYGLDIKLAGSLSLVIGIPTMLVAFIRYSGAVAFAVLNKERQLFRWMMIGSIAGTLVGGTMLGLVPTHYLIKLLGIVLLISAIKVFLHMRICSQEVSDVARR